MTSKHPTNPMATSSGPDVQGQRGQGSIHKAKRNGHRSGHTGQGKEI